MKEGVPAESSRPGGRSPARAGRIWVDLDNSPHVPLFVPIISHYRQMGVDVILTARDHSQTIELLDLAGLDGGFTVIGRHYGKGRLAKVRGLIERARALVTYIRAQNRRDKIAVAVSHGSRSMVLAAWWLKIPVFTMYDYEFTETRIFNTLSNRVCVPEAIPDEVLDQLGLRRDKRLKYPGIKEELYLRKFEPEAGFRQRLLEEHDAPQSTVVVVVRPPATTANYHAKEGEMLLDAILSRVLGEPHVFTIIVPRTRAQATEIADSIKHMPKRGIHAVLDDPVRGVDLLFAADLVISGGGTMNREAALLGLPVYSIFAGRQGALDAKMEKEGLITFVRTPEDVEKIELKKRRLTEGRDLQNALTDRVERFVIDEIDEFLD
ncbi:MAG TPA: DUF354 domain-containing protein [Pyrinomonadaceae bacterium]|nr:DUF354 domain-containing protein [Pyrinomonadaceae bacterium]